MAELKHWIFKIANQVEEYTNRRKGPDATVVCASGISPSGVVHLGNLREIFTAHLVKEELVRRGRKAVHLHFWDDYDRFRKVPANVPEEFSKYIGWPLSEIPDPEGKLDSYAERFMSQFTGCMKTLGIEPDYIRQSEAYKAGVYKDMILESFAKRLEIFDVLLANKKEEQQDEELKNRESYYPFKVYCEQCHTDLTQITAFDAQTATVSYSCEGCSHQGSYSLQDKAQGKLVWKVDWPMRWKHYLVDFEPGGVDHSTPGSSYTVGKDVVKKVYGTIPPFYAGYSFVETAGGSKISSSKGTVSTPENALLIIEPAILRWLYIRADIRQTFSIYFNDQVTRLYDEWDRLYQKVSNGGGDEQEKFIVHHCVRTSSGEVARSEMPLSFRLLASSFEITQGNEDETLRIINAHLEQPVEIETLRRESLLRRTCAGNWITLFQDDDKRIKVKNEFDAAVYNALPENLRKGVYEFVSTFEAHWSLEGLTKLAYGIPKKLLGLPPDVQPTEELKALQHAFFTGLYNLILGQDTGPRLPTLFVSIGKEKTRKLLTPA